VIEALISNPTEGTPPKPIFVQVDPADFITASALSTLVGAGSMGTLMPGGDSIQWMILREGNTVYAIPQKPLRHSVSYRTMQSANLLYGKNVNIAGGVWMIKAFTGLDGNTSDWMRIMSGIIVGGKLQNGQNPPIRWANLSYDDIGIGPENTAGQGVSNYITETYNQFQYYTRGVKGEYTTLYNQNMDTTFASNGWRPLLIWVSGYQPWV
jgi:hypothetical protein